MRTALRLAIVGMLAGAGIALLLRHDAPAAPAALMAAHAASTQDGPPPGHAAGTQPDGAARADANDRLQVNAELAYLFDYYLAGLGQRPLEAIRADIIRELDGRLRPAPAAEARRLLDAYLAYKRALVDLERDLPPATDPVQGARQRLAAVQQLRSAYFSNDDSAGLFGASDAYDLDAIARLDINSDASLSDAQRQQRLAALDARLPPKLREDREAPTRIIKLEAAVSQARAQGADDNDIYRLRATALSPSAAARLADVDREEADWQRRISAYQSQRRQLQQSASDAAALQQLRDAGFTPDEQKRLPAYE
ncbi:lipase chaperone [Duganella sp. FT134W]|uniref:Lipase helper protein n=1 Tax=Duganella margarita TaxID=2692170 RepID=A0A7X4H3I5_9BURK|nr:lipase secretion chaperone [Duganella margarita]MYM73637.1 lipase chaperone [Duganella margarita]